MFLQEFLTLILPEEGIKCYVSIQNKKVVQGFSADIKELSTVLLGLDAIKKDSYFACASFKEASNRRKDNAAFAKAFWLDIDAGEGKPYANADDAISAVDNFSNELQLPLPLIVRSGNGIHAYWPLDRPLEASVWITAAKTLKSLTESHGLHADPSRTADIASILRPPGTYNWKDPANPKAVVLESDDYELVPAEKFLRLGMSAFSDLNNSITAGSSSRPSMTQGFPDGSRTTELTKRAGWCLGPDGMDQYAALQACRAWNAYNTPPLDDGRLVSTVASIYRAEVAKSPIKPEIVSGLPTLTKPYSWGNRGQLLVQTEDDEGNNVSETISEYPIYLAGVCKVEGGVESSYIFRYRHPKEGWYHFFVPASSFWGPACKGIMAGSGATIMGMKYFQQYVFSSETRLKGEKMDDIRYDQFGWKGDYESFLVGNSLIQQDGKSLVAYGSEELLPRMQLMDLPPKGSVVDWTGAADRFFSYGMESYGFSLLASFGAPLMKFCVGEGEGGAILSLISGSSGRGKTRILEAASSIWGHIDASIITGKATVNAKFRIITKQGNLPVFIEELKELDPMILRDFIKDFTAGKDKERSRRDGSVVSKNNRYQTILFSTSNNSLLDAVRASNDAGAMARVLELNMELPESSEFTPDRMKNTLDIMRANRGWAGRAFISSMMSAEVLPKLPALASKLFSHYAQELHTQPEHRYIAHLLTCVAMAAIITRNAGILHFDLERILSWGVAKAKERIASITPTSPATILSMYINDHFLHCLTVDKEYKPRGYCTVLHVPTRDIKMRFEKDSGKLYVTLGSFRSWSQKNHYNYSEVIQDLMNARILTNDKRQVTLGAGTTFATGRTYCLEVDMTHSELNGAIKDVSVSTASAWDNEAIL